MPKTIVLLDIDETVWFHSDSSLNIELINYLIQAKTIDVFLFTDMTLHSRFILNRMLVIKKLEQLGLKIHGVVTPSDIFWNNPSISEDAFCAKKVRAYLNRVIKNNYPGRAYAIAAAEMKQQGGVSPINVDRSHFISRTLLPIITDLLHYSHLKGLMFELFLLHLDKETSKIIAIDDRRSVLSTIRSICEQQEPFLKSKNLIVDTIHIRQKNKGIYYSMELAKNAVLPHKTHTPTLHDLDSHLLQRDDVRRVLQEIFRLKQANTLFFKEGEQTKARRIEKALVSALKIGCEDVIQDCGVAKALAQHRIFDFWGLKKTTSILNVNASISVSRPQL